MNRSEKTRLAWWRRAVVTITAMLCLASCQRAQPNPFEHKGRYAHVAVGETESCAISSGGEVTCWGNHRAKHAAALPSGRYTRLSVGTYSRCGLRTDGRMACAGRSGGGGRTPTVAPIPPAGKFVALAGQCGLRSNGSIACATGRGSTVPGMGGGHPAGPFVRVAVGRHASCGVTSSGGLTCWGRLNPNTTASCRTGLKVVGLTPPVAVQGKVVDVAMGATHICSLLKGGAVRCWGDDACGQLVGPSNLLRSVASHPSANRTCGVTMAGEVECWGEKLNGISPPTGPFVELTVGRAHGCARRAGGELVCWGQNAQDQVAGNRSRMNTFLFHN